eukprot:gene4043-7332_t
MYSISQPRLFIDNSYSSKKLSEEKKEFKVMTYNVFGFKQQHNKTKSSVQLLSKFLSSYDLDFIAVNEVYQYEDCELIDLAKELNMNYCFGRADNNFGNAIFSKYIIDKADFQWLRVDPYERRCSIILKSFHFNLIGIHLDVGDEEIRLEQYNILLKKLQTDNDLINHPNILLGDFNALKIEDYSEEEWSKIVEIRKENKWELPRSDLIHKVEEDFLDVWSSLTDQKITSTCRFDTRIDYIFFSKMNIFEIVEFEKIENETSDHYPIYMNFRIKN